MDIFSSKNNDEIVIHSAFHFTGRLTGQHFQPNACCLWSEEADPAAAAVAAAAEAKAVLLPAAALAASLIAASLLHVQISSNSCSSSLIPGTFVRVFQSSSSRCSFGALSG